jgi:2-oxoglutarate ferredoxin oxidoreductase subunit alpha
MDRLARKFKTARKLVPPPVIGEVEGASLAMIVCGTTDLAAVESREQLADEHGLKTSYMRLKAYPFGEDLIDFIRGHGRVYVVDQNRDGQLFQLIRTDCPAELVSRLRSVRYYGGLPIDARTITDSIAEQEEL